MSFKIIIGADIVPTETNSDIFEKGNVDQIIDTRLLNELAHADYRAFNLEVPLTNDLDPIIKCGPNLIAATKCINGIKATGVDFLTLANNHILDQGNQGLTSTIKTLDNAKIAYAGAGMNLAEASKPYIFKAAQKKIGIYCCAEHEFSIADNKNPGANPFDELESLDHISDLKKKCDYVICLYHGGKEHYRYPSPHLQKVCRKIVEKGADLIVCQHSHCIGCKEEWQGSTIVYGQGNFLFDSSDSEFWKTSLLISVEIGEENKIDYIPIEKHDNGVMLAVDHNKETILSQFYERSLNITKKDFVEEEYKKFALQQIPNYITSTDLLCSSKIFRGINKLFKNHLRSYVTKIKLKKNRERLINQFECEAHRELILKGLKEYNK